MFSFVGERRFLVTPETPLVFLHLFKCAGTSVHDYLSTVFPPEAFFPGRHRSEYDNIAPGYLVYSGHMALRQWRNAPMKPHFVTWLREPGARTVSAYYFVKGLTQSYVVQSWNRTWIEKVQDMSLAEFVHSRDEGIRATICNAMSRALAAGPADERGPWWWLAWKARAALKRFAYIGIAEQTDECLDHLARRFQLPPPSRTFRSNTYAENAKSSGNDVAARNPATPEITAAIERHTRADLLLYRKARALSAQMT